MRIEDINSFKGQLKAVLKQWGNSKIDEVFPNKPQIKAFAKNGLNNIIARMDTKINKYIDGLVLFAGDEKGVIDTDSMIDMVAAMFNEMELNKYQFDFMDMEIGKGKVVFNLPQNFMFDLLLGKSGNITMTVDDILEMKELFNG